MKPLRRFEPRGKIPGQFLQMEIVAQSEDKSHQPVVISPGGQDGVPVVTLRHDDPDIGRDCGDRKKTTHATMLAGKRQFKEIGHSFEEGFDLWLGS